MLTNLSAFDLFVRNMHWCIMDAKVYHPNAWSGGEPKMYHHVEGSSQNGARCAMQPRHKLVQDMWSQCSNWYIITFAFCTRLHTSFFLSDVQEIKEVQLGAITVSKEVWDRGQCTRATSLKMAWAATYPSVQHCIYLHSQPAEHKFMNLGGCQGPPLHWSALHLPCIALHCSVLICTPFSLHCIALG